MTHLLKQLFVLFLCTIFSISMYAENPKREFRATWLATVSSIDWPNVKNNATSQKAALDNILNALETANMNAVCFQVRSLCDAMYKSSYEPWSSALTGTRGKDPGYDPLAYLVEEAHKRGIEVHAWVNPFRYETSAGAFGTNDPVRKRMSQYILSYDNGSFSGTILDPGRPEVREYNVMVIKEIVQKYDIDGVLFDDYFYPYGGTTDEDAASKALYKNDNQTDTEWRAENIDKAMKAVYDMIQETKPWVRFGIAPFGIWSTDANVARKYGITLPSGIVGTDAYKLLGCNTISWMDGGYVDYVSPQLYWATTSSGQSYVTLSKWWSDMAKHFTDKRTDGKKIHFYSSQACYRDYGNDEMGLEISNNRQHDQLGAPGSIFYNTNTFISTGLPAYLSSTKFAAQALPPAMDWKKTTALAAPTNINLNGSTLTWQHASAERFTVYAYPKGSDAATALADPANLLRVVYGNTCDVSEVFSLEKTTFAVCAYDRYGNEYAHVLYNDGPAPEPEPEPEPTEGDVSIKKLWSKTMNEATYLVGIENRSIACYDGLLYIPTTSTKTFSVINANNGSFVKSLDLGVSSTYQAFNLCITDDGQLLAGNSNLSKEISVFAVDKAVGGSTEQTTSLNIGRSDYFATYGNWKDNGYLISCSNTGYVACVPFQKGALKAGKTLSHSSLPSGGISTKAIPVDEESFLVNSSITIPTRHSLATGALLESFGREQPASVGVSGMATFMVSGNRYLITPADGFGGFDVFDITKGLDEAKTVIPSTDALGTNNVNPNPSTVGFAVRVEKNDAFIYVLAPNNGLAAYKFTFTPKEVTEVRDNFASNVVLAPTNTGVSLSFAGIQRVTIYSANGMLIHETMATDSYTYPLSSGMYIIRVGENVYKFVR